MTDDEKIAVVTDILDSWSAQDWDRVASLFAPDGVLHSVMSTPIVGREAFAARVAKLHEGLERIQLHIKADRGDRRPGVGGAGGRLRRQRPSRRGPRGRDPAGGGRHGHRVA